MPNEIYHRSNWGESKAEDFGDVYYDHAATNKLYNHSDYYENSDGTDATLKDLNNKASIVLTPTAYSDGSLNTVIPPYAPSYTENVTFVTSEWANLAEGWSIDETNNKLVAEATWTGINKRAQYPIPEIQVGKTVKFSFDVVLTAGKFHFFAPFSSGNVGYGSPNFINQSGSYSFTYVASGSSVYFRNKSTDFAGEITNIRVEVIEEADFDFSRGSSATRVNEQGLIEDSQGDDYPRIDFTDGIGSLLLEPQRTNLVTYSEDFSQWASSGVTITSNSAISPDGTQNASLFSHSGGSFPQIALSGITFVSSANYFPSLYVKSDGTTQVQHSLIVNGQVVNFTPTNEWVRVSDLIVSPDTSGSFVIAQNSGSAVAASFYIWGGQLEQGDYATSYIPTSGSTVTRSADLANNSGNADLFNDSEGVLYAEIAALDNDGTNRSISISDSTDANRIELRLATTDDRIEYNAITSSVTQASIFTDAYDVLDFNKIALLYKDNDFRLFVNGTQVATDTSGTAPTGLKELAFDLGDGSNDFYGDVKCVAVFKEALTDAELQQLTS